MTKQNVQTVLAVGPRKIPKINKRRAFNKAVGPGKNAIMSIPDSIVLKISLQNLTLWWNHLKIISNKIPRKVNANRLPKSK